MAGREEMSCERQGRKNGGRNAKFETSATIGKHCNNYKQ